MEHSWATRHALDLLPIHRGPEPFAQHVVDKLSGLYHPTTSLPIPYPPFKSPPSDRTPSQTLNVFLVALYSGIRAEHHQTLVDAAPAVGIRPRDPLVHEHYEDLFYLAKLAKERIEYRPQGWMPPLGTARRAKSQRVAGGAAEAGLAPLARGNKGKGGKKGDNNNGVDNSGGGRSSGGGMKRGEGRDGEDEELADAGDLSWDSGSGDDGVISVEEGNALLLELLSMCSIL